MAKSRNGSKSRRWKNSSLQRRVRDGISQGLAGARKSLFGPKKFARNTDRSHNLLLIETLEARTLLSTFTVTSIADSGSGTFRDAIVLANANAGADIIEFNLAGSGVHTISPLSALPTITNPVAINGNSQPGYSGTPQIELSGATAGSGANGLQIFGGFTTVRGLAINRFSANGIRVAGQGNAVIQDNYIGTTADGTQAAGNAENGIVINYTGLAPSTVRGNVVSGNHAFGIRIEEAKGLIIQGNRIGTNAQGTVAVGNLQHGIAAGYSQNLQIGGSGTGEGNLVSGNRGSAIVIGTSVSTNNRIQGNYIGMDAGGRYTIRNGGNGVAIQAGAHGNTVGGPEPGAGNLISGNDTGINIRGSNNLIHGNLVGTNADGNGGIFTEGAPNRLGMYIDGGSSNTIRNNVFAKSAVGISITGIVTGNLIENNWIGTNQAGATDLANGTGVSITGSVGNAPLNNLIQGNVIQHNAGNGINISAGYGNAILSNSIFNNLGTALGSSGLGIDLGDNGVTANDANDLDGGPNYQQNYPVIDSAVPGGGQTTIQGTFHSAPNTWYRIEYFSSSAQDNSGFGEGQVLRRSMDVLTDGSGNATLSVALPVELPDNNSVSATATLLVDHDGNSLTPLQPRDTSEFAQSFIVGADSVIGTFDMPIAGTLSVGIYDSDGNLVRTLLEAISRPAGPVPLFWDGTDDFGNAVSGVGFEWRAIVHEATAIDDGQVGDRSEQPWGINENSHWVSAAAVDPAGNVYENSDWEETGYRLRKWSANGNAIWAVNTEASFGNGGEVIAADGIYVYVAFNAIGQNRVMRFSAVDGSVANWPGLAGGYIVANASGGHGVRGLAADATRLWVSNATQDQIQIFNKSTGALVSQFSVTDPHRIALDNGGDVWVANRGDRVTRYSMSGVALDEIAGFQNPRAVAVGGPANHLFVGDFGTSTVREFDPATLRQVRELFGPAQPGPVSDYLLRWSDEGFFGRGDLAVDATGNMIVVDFGNQRVLTYTPNGTHVRTRFSEFVPTPFTDPMVDPDMLLSGGWQYEVDYTPGPTYGEWELTHNWRPTDGEFLDYTVSERRRINGGDYKFSLGIGGGMMVYALEPTGMRRSAIIGADANGLWNWTDSDGDGHVEEVEKVYHSGPENSSSFDALAPGTWVDHKGNFWIAHWNNWRNIGETVKVPLMGFDGEGNPLYDWATRETIVPVDLDYYFDANNMRVSSANGEIYLLGTTPKNEDIA